jgi:hypothetical protein
MSVWLCIPSARPNGGTAKAWKERGYRVALFRDPGSDPVDCADLVLVGEYPGYAQAVNALAKEVLAGDADCRWIVSGGDDTLPDPNKTPERIAVECTQYFTGTFGVMQPVADRFAGGSIDRIAGSPWMGREWCERANQGAGPMYPGFSHMFTDEALLRTAELLGVYWKRPDLMHFHDHFTRLSRDVNSPAVGRTPPPHLVKWNTPQHWNESKALFQSLEAQGFAPCMPLVNA